MKKLQIALIGIIGAVMVFLCVALGISLSRGIPSAGSGNYSLGQEEIPGPGHPEPEDRLWKRLLRLHGRAVLSGHRG